MRVVFFGTFDARLYQRVAVLAEGLAAAGDDVVECNVPLALAPWARVRMLGQPWRAATLPLRLAAAWAPLVRKARRLPPADAVVVGYMGHFDVHLARALWRRRPIVLDFLIAAEETALDRRVSSVRLLRSLSWLDRKALGAADMACVDTEERLALLPPRHRRDAVVVPVGAPSEWFARPRRRDDPQLRVVFFGSFTPLQGAPVIGRAIALLAGTPIAFTMIGRGQDFSTTRQAAAPNPAVRWVRWLHPDDLPPAVADHDVSLGIFGTSPKARRVVPMKVFQGAAAGTAIVTSDTPPQRRALGDAGVFVPPDDATALAEALLELGRDRERVWALREAAHRRADEAFRPAAVVEPLRRRLAETTRS